MAGRLYEFESEQINAMQSHPIHRDLVATIARLIRQLSDCVTYADVYGFQQDLLGELLAIEEHRAGCSRVVKRLERGRGVPADAVELCGAGDSQILATWQLERDVCVRGGRQLRCVGDALAWKVFDYQRNFIAVLSRNAPPGPMAGKVGLVAERRFLTETWHDDGHFALMHDLTWCLRIGDATVFTPGMFELREIKTNDSHQVPAQKRRILEAAEALRSHTPMPGGVGQVLVEIGPARLGPARLGPARLGPARLGPARLGPGRLMDVETRRLLQSHLRQRGQRRPEPALDVATGRRPLGPASRSPTPWPARP